MSVQIQDMLSRDLLQFIEPIFPNEVVRRYEGKDDVRRRDRIFNSESTLLTMIVTALHDDKSQVASVQLFQSIFEQNRKKLLQEMQRDKPDQRRKVRIQKSKTKEISLNTAAYSKARDRIEQGLIDEVFKATLKDTATFYGPQWHGRTVFNTDGTYLQLQDTPEIPEKYRVQQKGGGLSHGYPQALLQVITQQGSGFVHSYSLGSRADSELRLIEPLLNGLPEDSLLLADDLYNCYWLMALLIKKGVDFIVPDKKGRTYKEIKKIAAGDMLVEIPVPRNVRNKGLPEKILLRRIEYASTENPEITYVLLTSILDEEIGKDEVVRKYAGRWDIEITIREVKVLMGFSVLRGKSEDMVFKEIGVALTAYNLVRRIIAESVIKTDFPPETDFVQKFFETYKTQLVDRKGRVYSRWAPGRPSGYNGSSKTTQNTRKRRTTLSPKNESGKVQ
jgi:hypothetical protein